MPIVGWYLAQTTNVEVTTKICVDLVCGCIRAHTKQSTEESHLLACAIAIGNNNPGSRDSSFPALVQDLAWRSGAAPSLAVRVSTHSRES